MASESAIDSEPTQARGIIILLLINLVNAQELGAQKLAWS